MRRTAVLLVSVLMWTGGSAMAANQDHLVVKGDTLYSLSKRYGVTLEQLKQWNRLNSDQVYIGQKLVVTPPGRSAATIEPLRSAPTDTGFRLADSMDRVKPASARLAVVNGDRVNLRKEGKLSAPVLFSLQRGTTVEILQKGDQWSQVKAGETVGYIASEFIELKKPPFSRSGDLIESRLQKIITPLLGIPYKLGGSSLEGFDCSGFTQYVMSQLGVDLPRVSEEQFSVGSPVERDELQAGDLLFFDSYGTGKITHVAIYMGDNKIVHSATKEVEINDAAWYFNHYPYFGAKRVVGR